MVGNAREANANLVSHYSTHDTGDCAVRRLLKLEADGAKRGGRGNWWSRLADGRQFGNIHAQSARTCPQFSHQYMSCYAKMRRTVVIVDVPGAVRPDVDNGPVVPPAGGRAGPWRRHTLTCQSIKHK